MVYSDLERRPGKIYQEDQDLARTYSIITSCMGRLEHLKQSLPAMLRQDAQVIVVDYSCPERSGEYVETNFPAAQVVRVEGETEYCNSRSRNAGAAIATGEMLIFCDADTIIADHGVAWIDEHLPAEKYGWITNKSAKRFVGPARLSRNQLRGFQVISAAAFHSIGGFDEVLHGYADGADVEIERRLHLINIGAFSLDIGIIHDVVVHGDAERVQNYADPISKSYGTGLLYSAAKLALLRLQRRPELPLEHRQNLYDAAEQAVAALRSSRDQVEISFAAEAADVGMPSQLGYRKAATRISLKVELIGETRIDKISD